MLQENFIDMLTLFYVELIDCFFFDFVVMLKEVKK